MKTPRTRIPDLTLERYALGELDAARAAALRAQLEADPELAARLEALRADDARTRSALAPDAFARQIEGRLRIERARADAAPTRRPAWVWAAPALGAALALVLVVVLLPRDHERPLPPTPDAGGEIILLKGSDAPALTLHRRAGAGSELLPEEAEARSGDELMIRYATQGAKHGVILSVDGRGAVTLHFPAHEGGSTQLSGSAQPVALEHGYRLDDAPRFERFFFVTSAKPIAVPAVMDAARRLAADADGAAARPLDLSGDMVQSSVLIRKVP